MEDNEFYQKLNTYGLLGSLWLMGEYAIEVCYFKPFAISRSMLCLVAGVG